MFDSRGKIRYDVLEIVMENFSASNAASLLSQAQKFIDGNDGIWGFLVLVIAVLGIVAGWITGFFKTLYRWTTELISKRSVSRSHLPTETLRFVLQPNQARWGYGTKNVGDRHVKIIHASCTLYATNITRGSVLVASSYMKKPKSVDSVAPLIKEAPPNAHYWGPYPILAGHMSEVRANYVLDQNACRKGHDLIAHVVFIDQLGNEHHVKNVIFKAI